MSYLLNSIPFSTYGIVAGHCPSSNISLQGCFDFPVRIGQTYYEWAEGDIEPFVDSSEIFFAGMDIVLYGSITGTNTIINSYLKALYDVIDAFTDLVTLVTPYGSFSVQVKSIVPQYLNGGCLLIITFREPVITLTGGTLPAIGADVYTIDGIPMSSFGLYLSKAEALHDLPELKEQFFTKYGSEGYQITKRKNKTLEFNGFIIGTSLTDFQNKIKALYKLFSSSGTRNIKINDEIYIDCFAADGFRIENIYLYNNLMIGNFKISLMAVNVNPLYILGDETGIEILTMSDELIYI
jgi:hypothetical protein